MSSRNGRMLVLVAAVSSLLVMGGCGGPAVIPTSYNTFNSTDGTFKIQYPAGWEAEGGGRAGYSWAKFTSGGAKIAVDTSLVGSLVGDIAQSHVLGLGVQADAPEMAPVAVVHAREKPDFQAEAGVEEQEPVPARTGFGDARKSDFSGTRTFGGSIRGCRATTLGRDYRFRVVCECSESDWNDLKPAFDKVIESLSMGTQ